MKRAVRKFYTLVEIMTVIVIAAILFGIGIPAFTTMIQGSNMTIAIRQLSAKISAARAYAVTNRCKVAVLLPEVVENAAGAKKDDCSFSAYRVCVVDSANTFQEWIEDENWKTLPNGIYRESVSNTKSVTADATDIGGKDTGYPALIFNSKGQIVNDSSSNPEILLRHGRYVNGQKIPTGGSDHKLTINQYSGKVKVEVSD